MFLLYVEQYQLRIKWKSFKLILSPGTNDSGVCD